MSNRERGTVTLEIDGKTYALVLDVNAICELEGLFSTETKEVSFEQVLSRVARTSVIHIRGLVWAALRRYHPEITVEQAGGLIQAAGGLVGFGEKLKALAGSTQPDAEDVETNVTSRPRSAQARRRARGGGISTSRPADSA